VHDTPLAVHASALSLFIIITIINIIIIIIMQRLTRHMSVIRMTNRRRGDQVDLRFVEAGVDSAQK